MLESLSASFVYTLLKDGLRWASGKGKRQRQTEVIRLREKWRPLFAERIQQRRIERLREDVIIRDVARFDSYPHIDDKAKGISPWFRVGLIGTYHRGIEIGLQYEGLVRDPETNGWRNTDYKANEQSEISAILVGYVPYERIEEVNWDGDEFYGYPHIFCHFRGKKKEPYERLAYCERRELNDIPFYTEIANYGDVSELTKRRGIER